MKALQDEQAAADLKNQYLPKDATREDFMKIDEGKNPNVIMYHKKRTL